MLSQYYNREHVAATVANGGHRAIIGGLWDEIGSLQLNFLKAQGLRSNHTLLDIGCGSLRLGVPAVDYLDAGNYWGTDLNSDLLEAGYENEIVPSGLQGKLPRHHLVEDDVFAFPGIPREFDFVVAQSLFTHLPIDHLRLCLTRMAEHLAASTTFLFTVFTAESDVDSCEQAPGIVSYRYRDPYHYALNDLRRAAEGLPWRMHFIGDWNHPRNQKMVRAELEL